MLEDIVKIKKLADKKGLVLKEVSFGKKKSIQFNYSDGTKNIIFSYPDRGKGIARELRRLG